MQTFLVTVHVVLCVLLVLLVMIQSGKGAEVSASFGGSSQTVFGSSGGANFFTRFTQVVAALFMVTSVLLTLNANRGRKSVVEDMPAAASPAPATAAPATSGGPATPATGATSNAISPGGTAAMEAVTQDAATAKEAAPAAESGKKKNSRKR